MVSAGAGAHKLEFRAAEHVVYGVLGVIQIVVVITFFGFVGESNRYLSGECVLVDGWNWPQIKVKDYGFFLSIAKSFFYLSLGRFLWVGRLQLGGRQGGGFKIRGFFFRTCRVGSLGRGWRGCFSKLHRVHNGGGEGQLEQIYCSYLCRWLGDCC